MDNKRLERILILILALLDFFLLVVVLADRVQTANSRRDTVETLTALLADSGIEIGPEVDLLQSCPPRCTVTRDLELEQRRVQALLGAHTSEDLGGGIWYYAGENGQLRMRGTGELEIMLRSDYVLRRGRSRLDTAAEFFARCGVGLYDAGLSEDPVYCCAWDSRPVFNAVLTFGFTGNMLQYVTGTVVFNQETQREEIGMDAVSVLVRFMDLVNHKGFLCSRVEALTPGYLLSVTVSGESTLTPVWRIEADTGALFINAVTGATENPYPTELSAEKQARTGLLFAIFRGNPARRTGASGGGPPP